MQRMRRLSKIQKKSYRGRSRWNGSARIERSGWRWTAPTARPNRINARSALDCASLGDDVDGKLGISHRVR
jgi:hypothetical protein